MEDEERHEVAGRARLDPFEITARARGSHGDDGSLALPRTAHWPIFPFVTEGLRVRPLEDPVLSEPPRRDVTAEECGTCRRSDENFVWSDERWLVSMSPEPESLPGAVLHPRAHLDFPDLTEELGGELGVLLVRIQRALAGIEGVGSVHVYKWGDGGAHLHVFVVARPRGMMQLRGMFLTTWMHILPPLPQAVWAALRSHVAATLSSSGTATTG